MVRRLVGAVCGLQLLGGPAIALDPARALHQYALQVWREELPQNTVHCILQTQDGYLWLGTYEGLLRFDGVRFRLYEAAPAGPLPGATIWGMAEAPDGTLWLGTNAGLVSYRDGRFTTLSGVLDSTLLFSVTVAPDASLWLASDRGLTQLRDGAVVAHLSVKDGLPSDSVRAVAVAKDGSVWAATGAGLARIREGRVIATYSVAQGLPHDLLRSLLIDREGRLWAGGYGGLAVLDGERFTVYTRKDGLPDDFVRALFEDRAGSVWVGTENGGLARIRGGRVEAFTAREGLSNDSVRAFLEDREGALWVGTNGGLNRFQDGKFTVMGTAEGLPSDFARVVLEDRAGDVWIGTDGGGLTRVGRDGRLTTFTTRDGLTHNSVRALAEDSRGRLWVGTRGGLTVREGGRLKRYAWATDSDPARELVRAILEDRAGTVWLGTEGGGLVALPPEGPARTYTAADGLAHDDVRSLFEDRAGRLWIGTRGGVSLREGEVLRTLGPAEGLEPAAMFAFHEDADGVLWAGGEGGLARREGGGRFRRFTRADGLCDDRVFRILEDDDANLWLTSNKGICRVARAELAAAAAGQRSRVSALLYGRADGMRATQCNGASQPAGWRSADGRLWFPTVAGVVMADPRKMAQNALPPPVEVEELRVDGRTLLASGPIVIPPGTEQMEIHYTGLSFLAPEKVRFRYRLEGFDRDFVEAGSRRVAYYTNLSPGTYRFQALACNNDGLWNETGATLALEVVAPWWKRTWAVALWGGLIAGAAWGVLRWRTLALQRSNRRLEQRVGQRTSELDALNATLHDKVRALQESELRALEANRAKSVFLSSMSHELRTPLNAIIGFSSVLLEKLPDRIPAQQLKFLGNIHTSGEHLLTLINDILDLSKIEAGRMELFPEPVDVRYTLEGVRTVMRGVTEGKGIEIEVDLPSDLPRVVADPGKFKQIFFNLLSNAVKFSPEGSRVSVRGRPAVTGEGPLPAPGVLIEVIDQGVGIAAEDQEAIFEEFRQAGAPHEGTGLGLALVRRLLRMHGGDVAVSSTPGQGSTFRVYLPCDGRRPALADPAAAADRA